MDGLTYIARIDVWAFRCPIDRPVETSFGIMYDRPAVFIRIEDQDGGSGWGEIWANWPAAGAEHRVRLLEMDVAPLVLRRKFREPHEIFHALEQETRIRAVQCGELGPFRQVIAGLDMAIWDLFARRAGVPLRRLIRAEAPDDVPTYASGISIHAADTLVPAARRAGHRTFKLKVGFDSEADVRKLLAVHANLQSEEAFAADANQAWTLQEACRFLERIGDAPMEWLEEPIPVFSANKDWRELAARSPIPLAGGENIAGQDEFANAVALGALRVIQPDVAKWGGVTGCVEVARYALSHGRRYCPHFLGGGIGLMVSAEMLAGVGGNGKLEVDVNHNPLRSAFFGETEPVEKGLWKCINAPGIGVESLPESLQKFETLHREIR